MDVDMKYIKITKKLGFTVAVNLMYTHLILKDEEIILNIYKDISIGNSSKSIIPNFLFRKNCFK